MNNITNTSLGHISLSTAVGYCHKHTFFSPPLEAVVA